MARKLTPQLSPTHVLEIRRDAITKQKLVYVLLADQYFTYQHGKRSKIVYIGTTKKGVTRIASSTAERAQEILKEHGVRTVIARVLTCSPRKKVRTWKKLETAMLLAFRAEYGRVPYWNSQGRKLGEGDVFSYFSRETIRKRILDLD